MKNHYDIAVIGGGPAGATFAREIARSCPEKRIVLIDEKPRTGSKVCGGLLAPDAQKVLAQFDLDLPKSILADPQIFDVKTIDLATGITRNYQRHYLNMDRAAFDEWLLSLIPENVDVIRGRCHSLTDQATGKVRVEVDENGEKAEFHADIIVGADGGSSIVRRTYFDSPSKLYISIQEHFKDDGGDMPSYSCIYDPETSDSCSWTIRKDGYVIFGGAFDIKSGREAYFKQKARVEEFLGHSFGEAVKIEACLLTSPRKTRDFISGKGHVFLIGEAAGLISASSFEGISSAFLSGKYLSDAFASENDPDKVLKYYKRKTAKLRLKLLFKIPKMKILCSPLLRKMIMKSGICSIEKY
ncbi:MAG: FAD-binding protein [Clostridia bacterium]|nr:FAD-binding protein [Clostridia bacterium]